MTSQLRDRDRSVDPFSAPLPAQAKHAGVPGKQTMVQRMAGAPVQRQGGPSAPKPIYQYGPGTKNKNDCGPASMWMVLRLLGHDHEVSMHRWIVAHRPQDEASWNLYNVRYAYSYPGHPVGPQERLDVARWFTGPAKLQGPATEQQPDGHLPTPSGVDGTMGVGALRTGLRNMLRALGVEATDAELNQVLPLATDDGGLKTENGGMMPPGQGIVEHKAEVLAYLHATCVGETAVIALGHPTDAAWGWGGDKPSGGGNAVPLKNANGTTAVDGHYVVITSDGGTGFTVFDPAWAVAKAANDDQVIEFLAAHVSAAAVNLITVPIAALRELLGEAAPAAQRRPGPMTSSSTAAPSTGGSGAPLPAPTRAKMERAFAADFSAVRVHEGDAAPAIGALAYAQGEELHFAPGQYAPGTRSGDALIGHELAHVVQQREGRVRAPQGKDGAVVTDAALEAEADHEGDRAADGLLARDGSLATDATHAGAAPAQRQAIEPTPTAAGPIPTALLSAAIKDPAQAMAIAQWCTTDLLAPEALQAFWAATPQATRGAQLGEMAVRLGRLEFMLGWIAAGGLSTQTTTGWESGGSAASNLSNADGSSNTGEFPARYQDRYGGRGGMSGYDWCGMFVGYIYGELLHLDGGAPLGPDGIEGWRGADTVLASGEPKIWPQRGPSGAFTGWSGAASPPRPGDIAVITHHAYVPVAAGATDGRTPDHVALVEEVTSERVRTIDGNAALVPFAKDHTSAGSHVANAVSGRGYSLQAADASSDDKTAYYNNQSRILCIVRITDRPGNFAAPSAAAPHGAPVAAATGIELIARVEAANLQVAEVLNGRDHTTGYDPRTTVFGWVKDRAKD